MINFTEIAKKRLCVLCEYAKDRVDIAGVYCTGGFVNEDFTCEHFKKFLTEEERKENDIRRTH